MASPAGSEEVRDKLIEKPKESLLITSNWEINNGRSFDDCVSTITSLQAQDKINLEDVVTFDTCVALKLDLSGEPCTVEFKTLNSSKINRIAVVSEASVLEFFKQSGEYASTVFAEFVDEFQDHVVYFAETKIDPPSTEASIKFTRTKTSGPIMWIYGIKLVTSDAPKENISNIISDDMINRLPLGNLDLNGSKLMERFLNSCALNGHNPLQEFSISHLHDIKGVKQKSNFGAENKYTCLNGSPIHDHGDTIVTESESKDSISLKMYIDLKLSNLEKQLMDKIETSHKDITEKLDKILRLITKDDDVKH
ncbi:hypothetical protein QAD02_020169 [Eretmocerus hayati]|uniref:Uncharacterized protein n=1 Tax=Eretmocerus hayati TaxID=131215 RepID=A0ACC2PLR0_9HYME|nr:hypothetical protein QAD02_020169 [Eretmocerus hayati]